MPRTRSSILSVLIGGMLFGTAGTAQALGPSGTNPLAVGALRLIVGAIVLVIAMPLLGYRPSRIPSLWRSRYVLVAAVCVAAYQPAFFAAMSLTGVAVGTLVNVGSAPVFAGLLAWIVLGHRPTPAWLLATGLCITGLVLLSWKSLAGGDPIGLVLALFSGFAIAIYTLVSKKELERGTSPVEVNAGIMVLSGFMLLPILVVQPLGWLATPQGAALALYLGVATMAIANVLYMLGLHGISPGPVTTLNLADPLTATILGVLVVGETMTWLGGLGLLLLFAGLVLQGFSLARAGHRAGRAASDAAAAAEPVDAADVPEAVIPL